MHLEPSGICKVLGVDTRIRIIELLKEKGPLGANNIAELVNITPAAVSQHLRILKHAGLVRCERKGYWIPYSIDEEALEKCRHVLNKVCTCGCHGTPRFRDKEPVGLDLESLKEYEETLRKELKIVQERISEIEANDK